MKYKLMTINEMDGKDEFKFDSDAPWNGKQDQIVRGMVETAVERRGHVSVFDDRADTICKTWLFADTLDNVTEGFVDGELHNEKAWDDAKKDTVKEKANEVLDWIKQNLELNYQY